MIKSGSKVPGLVGAVVVLGVAAAAVDSSFFVVEPTERAGVRMFGKVVSDTPYLPGPHLKVPFSTVDRMQVSLTTLHIPVFPVNTVDNQKIDLDISLTYRVPDPAVFHLMYGVGQSGNADITASIVPIVQDRVSRVFSGRNTNAISANRESIQVETLQAVRDALRDMFLVELDTLQIARINYSPAFIASNERSVTAKNEAIAEENRVKVSEFQAKQGVALAQGKAEQARAEAQGEADAIRIRAQANRDATVLQGEATASRYAAEIKGAGGVDAYVRIVSAQAQAKWDGRAPTYVAGENGLAAAFLPAGRRRPPACGRPGDGDANRGGRQGTASP